MRTLLWAKFLFCHAQKLLETLEFLSVERFGEAISCHFVGRRIDKLDSAIFDRLPLVMVGNCDVLRSDPEFGVRSHSFGASVVSVDGQRKFNW